MSDPFCIDWFGGPSAQIEIFSPTAGEELFDLVVPRYVHADLRDPGLSLEIGVDERLLSYPWELLHDGGEYLCLKHNIGRFVNGERAAIPRFQDPWDKELETVRVLIISVPNPQWEKGPQFDALPEA